MNTHTKGRKANSKVRSHGTDNAITTHLHSRKNTEQANHNLCTPKKKKKRFYNARKKIPRRDGKSKSRQLLWPHMLASVEETRCGQSVLLL